MSKIILKPGCEQRIRYRHPWIYREDIETCAGEPQDGDEVSVTSSQGDPIGRGFYSASSPVAINLLSFQDDRLDTGFFRDRLRHIDESRRQFLGKREVLRCVNGEGDLLPGLVVDRYGDVIVIQTMSAGMERIKSEIAGILDELYTPRIIYERNDCPERRQAGLPSTKGFLKGAETTPVEIVVDGLTFEVDFIDGAGTGFFLDHKANTRLVRKLAKNKSILDCYSYTGQFAVNAARGRAKQVTAIEIDPGNVKRGRMNSTRNEFGELIDWSVADVLDALANFEKYDVSFDIIILDPPAVPSTSEERDNALVSLKEINSYAMRLIKPGGMLMSSLRSSVPTMEEFLDIMRGAAQAAEKVFRVIGTATQDRDFPYLLTIPESLQLTAMYVEVF
ncbi:class I SAM-dependent rRNA methyltransferase [bacterium]|nr:class I SAM-dependent rRNA methyltransferase [candidate division CSSED10-310 bacterium]